MKKLEWEEQRLTEDIFKELWKESIIAIGRTSPNPSVACVVTDSFNKIIASGSTEPPGRRHAEIVAFDNFDQLSNKPQKINVYITLEPCSTYGRTPPCTIRIKNYKNIINNIYIENLDINLNKSGILSLHKDDIQLKLFKAFLEPHFAIYSFHSYIKNKRPQYFVKIASDTKGNIGSSEKKINITGEEGHTLTMLLRTKCDAVIVGPGTTRIDLPNLDLRTKNINIKIYQEMFDEIFRESIGKKNQNHYIDEFLRGIILFSNEIFENINKFNYQPYRIFILGKFFPEYKDLYEKQKKISEIISKPFYFLIQDKYKNQYELSHFEKNDYIITPNLGDSEFFHFLNHFLISLEVQKVLIEAGEKIFDYFYHYLSENDRIYHIQTNKILDIPSPKRISIENYSLKKIDTIKLKNLIVRSFNKIIL